MNPSPSSATVNSCESDYPKSNKFGNIYESRIISCGVNLAEVKIIVLRNRKIVKTFYRLELLFLFISFSFALPGYPGCFRRVLKCLRSVQVFWDLNFHLYLSRRICHILIKGIT